MKWSVQDPTKWHDWFAWHPIKLDHTYFWLVTFRRRLITGMFDDWWEYELKGDKTE